MQYKQVYEENKESKRKKEKLPVGNLLDIHLLSPPLDGGWWGLWQGNHPGSFS